MSTTPNTRAPSKQKNIILFIGKAYPHMVEAVQQYAKEHNSTYRLGLLHDAKQKLKEGGLRGVQMMDIILSCDTQSDISIQKALVPYQDELLAITCRGEDQIPLFTRIIPHVPYLRTPTSESLTWASDKILMRRRLRIHNKKIVPAYTVVSDTKKATLKKIEDKIGFPLMVKPSGLAASRLVSICYHKEELAKTLKKVFRKIKNVYKQTGGTWEPKVLVEQFMDGDMYSIDAYVGNRGKVYFCPLVHIKTGKSIGFDDFFGYQQITPTLLSKESVAEAKAVATEAVHALALRNTTAHIELMKTENGWKIIELGGRIGGFRHMLYDFSYGINHTMNDILIRIPEKPLIPSKVLGHSVAMKFFAKKEGKLTKLTGIKKSQELSSFKHIYINKKIGDQCTYAKHGGSSVFNIILFNKDRSALLADIRRLEQMIEIETA